MKRVYTSLRGDHLRRRRDISGKLRWLKGGVLSPFYWGAAHVYRVPGLYLHRDIAVLGLRLLLGARRRISHSMIYSMMFHPMYSVRYFEFDFVWRAVLSSSHIGHYLDVSSPRMFTLMLLRKERRLRADLVNPNTRDLSVTERLFLAGGVAKRCKFHDCTIQKAPFEPESFDTIISISVLEHIPEDRAALEKMWNLLKPGGKLLLSVPCAAEAFEEYIDLDEYGLLEKDDEGFVFGQRFYDEELLEENVFGVTGKPSRYSLYGERSPGIFFKDRQAQLRDDHSFWREPYTFGLQYKYYRRINDLPGVGVTAMEFTKY